MALKLADFLALSDEELIRRYDDLAKTTEPGLDWYREELNRRAHERDTAAMHQLTRWTVRLAAVSVVVAVVALVVAIISLWR
jgi:hypothetical protein